VTLGFQRARELSTHQLVIDKRLQNIFNTLRGNLFLLSGNLFDFLEGVEVALYLDFARLKGYGGKYLAHPRPFLGLGKALLGRHGA